VVDPPRAARAQSFAFRHLFQITLALFCASLPTAYGAARGSRVLAATGRMAGKELDRRVNETAQFLLDVLAPGAFSPNGSALRGIQKVRLMHAAVRAHLARPVRQRTEIAINQEDLLGMLFAFSVVVIRALRRLESPSNRTRPKTTISSGAPSAPCSGSAASCSRATLSRRVTSRIESRLASSRRQRMAEP
jgi:hypothetical protein